VSPAWPIAIIDSSLGGLNVVRALRQALPGEEIVFLADTARGPYGGKSAAAVTNFGLELLEQIRLFQPKLVAIACNTMASVIMPGIRAEYPDLMICGIVDAAAKVAIEAAGADQSPVIGIAAPEATIRSKSYERAIHRRRHYARLLLRPTPLLDAVAEEARESNDPVLRLVLRQYLTAMAQRGANVIVFASSWYSGFLPSIERGFAKIRFIDSAQCCADDIVRRLQAAGLLRGGEPSGAVHCLLTDDTPRFAFHAARMLPGEVDSPKIIPLDELYRASQRIGSLRLPA